MSSGAASMASQSQTLLPFLFYWCIAIPLVFVAHAGNISLAFPPWENIMLYREAYGHERVIQLTTNEFTWYQLSGGYGYVKFQRSIPLWNNSSQALANFTTRFRFIISKVSNTSAGDGLTFFLAPLDFEPPLKAGGAGLGLFNDETKGDSSTQVVAVEFDTYKNLFDPDDNHVGIDVNSGFSKKTASLNASDTLQNETLKNGEFWDAWVDYDGRNHRLEVFLLSNPSGNETNFSKPQSPILFYNIDLRKFLPENIMVGLSASTGDSLENHTVYAWKFSAEYSWKIENPAPIPATNSSAPNATSPNPAPIPATNSSAPNATSPNPAPIPASNSPAPNTTSPSPAPHSASLNPAPITATNSSSPNATTSSSPWKIENPDKSPANNNGTFVKQFLISVCVCVVVAWAFIFVGAWWYFQVPRRSGP